MQFVEEGHEEMRQLMAAIQVWRAAERPEDIVEVDTRPRTIKGGMHSQRRRRHGALLLTRNSGRGASRRQPMRGRRRPANQGFPTDSDLLDALEEYERQERGQALEKHEPKNLTNHLRGIVRVPPATVDAEYRQPLTEARG